MKLDCDEVPVVPTARYQTVGVRSFGRGLFTKEELDATQTSYTRFYRLHANQVVLSRLFGWEGAVSPVAPEFAGMYVSPEFPTFNIDTTLADPAYVGHYVRWERFHQMLAGETRGLGQRRQRVHPEALLALKIPLPDVATQRAIASQLDLVRLSADSLQRRFDSGGANDVLSMLPDLTDDVLLGSSTGSAAVSESVAFVSDTVHPGDDPSPADRFVGLQHVEGHTGRCLGSDPLDGLKGRKFRFQPGDIVYGYLRPYLNKAWVADCHGLCSVDQYVLRPAPSWNPELVAYALRGRTVLREAVEKTHSLQLPRLRSGLLAEMPIPVVPEAQQIEVLTRLDGVRNRCLTMVELRLRQRALATALVPSAMNAAFSFT